MYRVIDALVVRAALAAVGSHPLPWPDLTGDAAGVAAWGEWLDAASALPGFVEALAVASPVLANQLQRVGTGAQTDPRQVRRIVLSVLRYLLRATGRATPFGLFAGVAAARRGPSPAATWTGPAIVVQRADTCQLSAVVDDIETCLPLLRQVTVVANNLATERDGHLVLPWQSSSADGDTAGFVDVIVRRTPAVAAAIDHAATPILFADLAGKLCAQWPHGHAQAVQTMLAGLVRHRLLLTSLRPAMTCTDPEQHLEQVLHAAGTSVRPGHAQVVEMPHAVDARLGLDVVVPDVVLAEARSAGRALTLLTCYPHGLPAWVQWHAAFLDRYGPDALVPLAEVIDPTVGLGLPATFRGSDRTVTDPDWSPRDRTLAALVQATVMGGGDEILTDDPMLTALAGENDPAPAPPHVALHGQIHATDLTSIHNGQFTLAVTGGSRAAGASEGRFLRLLDPATLDRFRAAYAHLPTVRHGAAPVQVSCAPLRPDEQGLAQAPAMLATLLRLGEHPDPDDQDSLHVDDLGVGGDAHGLYLVWLSRRRLVEPTMLNAIELRHHAHPLARFLCELPRARTAVYMPFAWGALADLPYLPRLRHGRAVLALARWRLSTRDLPARGAPWTRWRSAIEAWRGTYRVPDRVHLVEADNLLPLDLDEDAHLALLRQHLQRHGHARLAEAPDPQAFGWTGGHVHELVIPLAATAPRLPGPDLTTVRTVTRTDAHLPGVSPWLYAKLYTHPGHRWVLLDQIAEHVPTWDTVSGWWYLPYPDPQPHLRLRLRLTDPAGYADTLTQLGAWATTARERGLLGRLELDTYQPETGRYGHGDAMTAAETAFIADSAAALAQHHLAHAAGPPIDAVTVASMLDLAASHAGSTAQAMQWLVQHLPHEPARIDRDLRETVRSLAGPTLHDLPGGSHVSQAWRARREALTAYRQRLAAQRDPMPVLASLLHVHHVRMHGADPDRERAARHLARTVALSWTATAGSP